MSLKRILSVFSIILVNNSKSWFEDNKHMYSECVLKPAQSLVSELSDFMLAIDPYLETAPTVGKTISRIYRDTRFSKDKSPFRTNIWITLKRPKKEWVDAPEEIETQLTFGFSDQLRLWVNEEEVYQGDWRWDPPGSDGRIRCNFANVRVRWRAGLNTIRAEVTNNEFFGWGLSLKTGLSNLS